MLLTSAEYFDYSPTTSYEPQLLPQRRPHFIHKFSHSISSTRHQQTVVMMFSSKSTLLALLATTIPKRPLSQMGRRRQWEHNDFTYPPNPTSPRNLETLRYRISQEIDRDTYRNLTDDVLCCCHEGPSKAPVTAALLASGGGCGMARQNCSWQHKANKICITLTVSLALLLLLFMSSSPSGYLHSYATHPPVVNLQKECYSVFRTAYHRGGCSPLPLSLSSKQVPLGLSIKYSHGRSRCNP